MAITRLWQAGFETGSTDEIPTIVGAQVTVSSAEKKTGTYSMYRASAVGDDDYTIVSVPATRQLRMGFWLYVAGDYFDDTNRKIISFYSGAPAELATFRGQAKDLHISASLTDTAALEHDSSTWIHYGIDIKVDSSAGWMKVYKDGVEILSVAGNTGNADIESVRVFDYYNFNANAYIDDIYIDDAAGEGAASVCSLLIFPYIVPNGAGNYTQWDPSAGNNWDTVDEVPASDADYVDTAVTDEFDSYVMSTYTLGAGESFQAVIPVARVQRGDTTELIALGTRYSATDLVGSDQTPGASYGYLWERQTAKPGGGDWDQTAVDGVEVVIKSRGTY